MSKMSWPMMVAVVVFGVLALLLITGPWSPREVEKDVAGTVVASPPRPLAPGTRVPSASEVPTPEVQNASTQSGPNFP